jgi:indole-3-acetate monooxygenase
MTATLTSNLLETARALGPEIRSRSAEIEAARRVPADLAARLAKAGFFRMLQPAVYGGLELDPLTYIAVLEELSRADGAVGWTVMKCSSTNYFAGFLPEAGARELFASNPAVVTSGSFNPRGRAVPVDGGYRISGQWNWGSGSQLSDWILGGAIIFDGEAPHMTAHGPALIAAFLPASSVQIIDTWDTAGMRGSGSHDFAVNDVFVPIDHTFAHLMARPHLETPLYRIPTPAMIPLGHGPIATGLARAAIDELERIAAEKTPLMSRTLLRDKELAQGQVGRAEGLLRSAQAFTREAVGEVWQSVQRGEMVGPSQITNLHLSMLHATQASLEVVNLMFAAGGGSSVHQSSPIQKALRDLHVAATHVMVSPQQYSAMGRAYLGLPFPMG